MQALLLSAGLGTRLRPHTEYMAKPSISFLNIPLMAYSLWHLEQAGLKKLVANTHHLPEWVESTAKQLCDPVINLKFSHEPQILGSGGGLQKALSLFNAGEPILLANADTLLLASNTEIYKELLRFHEASGNYATLLCCPHPGVGTKFGGVYVKSSLTEAGFERAEVSCFSKAPVDGLKGYHYTGTVVIAPRAFKDLPEGESNILYDVLSKAIAQPEKVSAFIDPGMLFFETGDPRSFLDSTRNCLELLNKETSKSQQLRSILSRYSRGWDNFKTGGVFSALKPAEQLIIKPESLGILGRNMQLGPNIELKNYFVLGSQCQIGGRNSIDSTVILPKGRVPEGENLLAQIRS
ncbi:MAG: NTP transferase domain-containing protein [Bdellovibrionales bacterium]|nr:NTP transferase domain-containing protein [Bdellovibrionales bacterium]